MKEKVIFNRLLLLHGAGVVVIILLKAEKSKSTSPRHTDFSLSLFMQK